MDLSNQNIESENIVIESILSRYESAKNNRYHWESHWQDCYDYAMPQRAALSNSQQSGSKRMQTLYDGTALDSVDQLAASLLGHLTPAWSQWFGLKAGPELNEREAEKLTPILEDIAKKIQSHFDRSNFAVEIHQCFIDLAVGGTATLNFEETDPGSLSAFKFSAVPIQDVVLEEGDQGFLDGSYRSMMLSLSQLLSRYPNADLPLQILKEGDKNPQQKFKILETILKDNGIYEFKVILTEGNSHTLLKEGQFNSSPSISFRWMKSPGEIYGRSPVMKALPDIKTANKVVELILKNASIAVTGIWQADDDGVLNPANIELVPGAIIPKAIGSKGLQPLEMPGRFDISELVLNDLRNRIKHALLTDKLGTVTDRRMTATEVLERSNEMALLLGATYGRLQSELLTPLIQRAFSILKRRGEIPDIALDGRYVAIDYRSPLARAQSQKDMNNILMWLETVGSMGAEASAAINVHKMVSYLGDALGVPSDLINKNIPTPPIDALINNPIEKEKIDV